MSLPSGNNRTSDAGVLYYGIKRLFVLHTNAHLSKIGQQSKAYMAYVRAVLSNVVWPGKPFVLENINETLNKIHVAVAKMLDHKYVRITMNKRQIKI